MTEKQVRDGRVAYHKLVDRKKLLLEGKIKTRANLYDGVFDKDFELVFAPEEKLAWFAFSKIAAETKRSNNIYVLISSSDIKNEQGKIVDKIFLYMDLENLSTRFVHISELGNFFREKNKNGEQANIVLNSNYCSGIEAFEAERLKFFLQLIDFPQEFVVKKYKNGDYLEETISHGRS